jgi:hypothetical protein
MKFKLEMDCNNAAFFDVLAIPEDENSANTSARRGEIARILKKIAYEIENCLHDERISYSLNDVNGNDVGIAYESD